jgi:osmotically-inducible protein OsmY
MNSFNFNIGATVHCKNGKCGQLQKLVVDPDDMEVTDLIVERGLINKDRRIVPVKDVDRATDDYIMLSINDISLEEYPEYRAHQFNIVEQDSNGKDVKSFRIAHQVSPYGLGVTGRYIPVIYHQGIQDSVEPGKEVITRGTPVYDTKHKIGYMDHMLVDSENGELTHLVINPGLFSSSFVLPISTAKNLEADGIILDINEKEIDQFPEYSPRDDDEIVTDLREKISTEAFLDDIEIAAENGVITMRGSVPDVATKRRLEYVVRMLDGVVEVENHLRPENVSDSQILTALATDPRTEFSVIEVIEDRGIITLNGQVDNVEILKAAVEITKAQPDVVKVINGLSVKKDEFSTAFVTRYTQNRLKI